MGPKIDAPRLSRFAPRGQGSDGNPERGVGLARNGKLPELKAEHDVRAQALAELTEALLGGHSDEVAPDKSAYKSAYRTADGLLSRVRAPEFDLTGLTREEAGYVQRMPPEAWAALQRYAQTSNEAGITSVALSSSFDVDERLVAGLAQFPLGYIALGRGLSPTLMARLQALPFLEHITQRGSAQGPAEYAALQQQPAPSMSITNPSARRVRKKRSNQIAGWTPVANDASLQSKLDAAMKSGHSYNTGHAVQAILREPRLSPAQKLQFLLSPSAQHEAKPAPQQRGTTEASKKLHHGRRFVPSLSAFVEESEHQAQQHGAMPLAPPLLARLCGESTASQRGDQPHAPAIGVYLTEILGSDLPLHDKITLCASTVETPHGPRTAAQLAMQNGNALVAGTMMQSILESSVEPEEKLELLAALGVSREDVETALAMPHMQKMPWVKYVSGQVKIGWEGLALLTDDRRVTLKDIPGTERYVLVAERMWTRGTGEVLCSADREIPQLKFHRIPRHERADDEVDGRFRYTIPPDWLVKLAKREPG